MIPWYIVKYYLQKHYRFCIATFILLLLTIVFYRYIHIFLAAWSFVLGIVVTYSWLSAETVVPNLLFMYKRDRKANSQGDDELTLMKTICTVCGQRRCPRHRPELNILAFQPWTNLFVTKKVDEAIDEFLNIVLKDYVYTWFSDLSSDEEFMDEFKSCIRFLASVMLRRVKKVDVPAMISDKLFKAGVQHLHAYLQAQKNAPGSDLQHATFEYLGPNLHCAMQSRKTEIEYLRRMVEALFPFVLPQQALQSKSTCALVREILSGYILLPALDTLANPDMINNLLLIFFDDTPPPAATEPVSPKVPFLSNFAKPLIQSNSSLHLVLNDVISPESPQTLYPFMQFLKNEAAINVLQFFLACEDFNRRILSPELSQGELVELHNMAKDLYRSYCAENALDRIKFDEEIVSELKEIVEGPSDQVIKLRTSTPLFKAYEHAYNLLDKTFLPLFHQSDDYYTMICGDTVQTQITRSTSNTQLIPKPNNSTRQPKRKEFGLSNIGNRIKGVFKSEGKSLQDELNFEDADTITIASCSSIDDQILESECEGFQEIHSHDLSTWRVTIPRVGARPDPENPKKQYFVFIIDVRRVDVSNETKSLDRQANWTVARKYNEFYVLEQKLSEFHGELLVDCQLPTKKSFGTSKFEFIDGKRETFELYLQKLLTKPYLKGSQLVYKFLTTADEFTTGFLPDINLGRMFKSVPMKLVKEKGQHLDPFLLSFEQSTEAPKPRPGKPERRDSDASMKSTSSEKLCGSMFENNANCEADGTPTYTPSSLVTEDLDGVFDIIIYVARFVYKIPDWFHDVLMTARILFKSTLENYLEWYTGQKLEQVTQEHRVVGLIHLLRDVLFFDTDPPRTDEQKRERFRDAYKGAMDFLPKPFVSVVGKNNQEDGTKLILDVLQQPKLNKQLSYVFLDIVILELFPELRG